MALSGSSVWYVWRGVAHDDAAAEGWLAADENRNSTICNTGKQVITSLIAGRSSGQYCSLSFDATGTV